MRYTQSNSDIQSADLKRANLKFDRDQIAATN